MNLWPNTTSVPDVILDEWLPHLRGAELAIVLRLARHAYGWRMESELVSVEELCRGTGCDRTRVLDGLWVLVTAGLAIREAGPPPMFRLVFDGNLSGLPDRLDRARGALAAKKSGVVDRESSYPQTAAAAEVTSRPDGLRSSERFSAAAAAEDGYEDLLPELKAMGNTDFQACHIIRMARDHERPVEWLVAWMAEANAKADKPGAFLQRMVEQNTDLREPSKPRPSRSDDGAGDPYNRPVSPERQAEIEARHAAEYERTRRMIIDGQEGVRPTDADLEASGWTSLKEALRKRIEADAPAAQWGARPYKRPTEEERAKVNEAKSELKAQAAARKARTEDKSAPPAPPILQQVNVKNPEVSQGVLLQPTEDADAPLSGAG
jgi:hypothetical protein